MNQTKESVKRGAKVKEPVKREAMGLVDAAQFLGTSPRHLSKMVDANAVPCRRFGTRYFFSREALREWLKNR